MYIVQCKLYICINFISICCIVNSNKPKGVLTSLTFTITLGTRGGGVKNFQIKFRIYSTIKTEDLRFIKDIFKKVEVEKLQKLKQPTIFDILRLSKS